MLAVDLNLKLCELIVMSLVHGFFSFMTRIYGLLLAI